ncbi:PHP domain protein [Caldicellulosiruptor hydrothermalis 108]|uniref:PHP domain protein n=1 Tax=Caldicellulosiruptor hydrothermalis (strain DSM 18901 / VKM B-2411 / 108) TaxID=632292 RepID=E4QAS2_CALH1|nr:endonuclease Q family protein [Caldicellulosiruptor hydrothermalis]ADQ07100.1 PHP domain protein [Caldicellulosiruptor hydrothermalis 108]
MRVYADLHVHIGFSNGRYIKVPSSKTLTLENIIKTAKDEKGLNVISIVDFLCKDVIDETDKLLDKGKLELKDGSLYSEGLLIIPAAEIELRFCSNDFHCLIFFEDYEKLKDFRKIIKTYFNQIDFSCPVFRGQISDFERIVSSFGLLAVPAHAFTPYKGFYSAAQRVEEVFKKIEVFSIELGLSADSKMVSYLCDVQKRSLLSNSDAHSLKNIAREFNEVEIEYVSAKDVIKSIKENRIVANYGVNPKLGKYHKSYCKECNSSFNLKSQDLILCPFCKSNDIVIGVEDRISWLYKTENPVEKPPYFYTFPFELVQGFGQKTIQKIIDVFENEINFIKSLNNGTFKNYNIDENIAQKLVRFMNQDYTVKFGAGGHFGRIIFE